MWSAFAKRWKGIPNEILSFNLFNEPTRHTAGENYLPLCMKLIDAIRKEDPSRFVIADGNACASLPVPGLYGIPSVGQAFRGYTPHAITHYGADFIGGIPKEPPTWPLAPGYGAHAWLRESPEDTVAKYQSAIDAGEFCMVGEFGARCTSPHGVVLDWMEHCLGLWPVKIRFGSACRARWRLVHERQPEIRKLFEFRWRRLGGVFQVRLFRGLPGCIL